MLGFAALSGIASAILPATPAFAANYSWAPCDGSPLRGWVECTKHVQFQIQNLTSENLTTSFKFSGEGNNGAVKSEQRNDSAPLPSSPIQADGGGELTPMYDVGLKFSLQEWVVRDTVYNEWKEANNYFQVSFHKASSGVGDSANDRGATLSLGHHVKGGKQELSLNTVKGTELSPDVTGTLDVKLRKLPATSPAFAGRYVFVVSDKDPGSSVGTGELGPKQHLPGDPDPDRPWQMLTSKEFAGEWRSKTPYQGLEPNVDYLLKCDSCLVGEPPELAFNGKSYPTAQIQSGKEIWVTTNKWGELVVTGAKQFAFKTEAYGSGELTLRAASLKADVKRLSRLDSDEKNPVYRIDIPERKRQFTSAVPDGVSVDAYDVWGVAAGGSWERIGNVMPTSKPKVEGKTLTFGAASFYFQNKPNSPKYTTLWITGSYATNADIKLDTAPGPEDVFSRDDAAVVASVAVKPATGLEGASLTNNGLAQEPLKLSMKDYSGTVINPDDDPGLAKAYDYVYFRDPKNGELITGMVDDARDQDRYEEGYTAVTPVRGGYVNELGLQAQADEDYNRVYMSTTKGSDIGLRPVLSIGGTRVGDPTALTPVKQRLTAATDPQAGARAVRLARTDNAELSVPAADVSSGAMYYARDDQGRPARAVVLTRYWTTSLDLPTNNPGQTGAYTVTGSGSLLLDPQPGNDKKFLETSGFLSRQGTYVPAFKLSL
ncbi:hypothetical protein ACFZAV_43825 [Streptomyces sp. NPDC008343]|uniref:hypothetical protein n=1 Tax=Streptomyces sp. NPDC008343 TaxID=3364828 RepID=UPI0036E03597